MDVIDRNQYDAGATEARCDLWRGCIRELNHSIFRGPREKEWAEIMKRRYEIAYLIDNTRSDSFTKGYNDTMHKVAQKRFGSDYYDRASDELMDKSGFGPLRHTNKSAVTTGK